MFPGKRADDGVMLRKVFESMEKSNVRAKLKSGELACPACGAKPASLPGEWNSVLGCANCGTKASLSEWASEDTLPLLRAKPEAPPPGTKIRVTGDGLGGTVWGIPAQGKFGFLMFFASVWLGIVTIVSGGLIYGFYFAESVRHSSATDTPDWFVFPFFGIFWAIGFGVMFAGLREKYLKTSITVSGGEVKLTKELFGRAKVKAMPFASIRSIAQKEFYQQNYKPVFGIEIKGDTGRIRFGSTLAEPEKAWLVASLRESVFGEPEETRDSVESPSKSPRRESFSLVVPGFGKSTWMAPLVLSVVGAVFLCVGIFFIEGESMPNRADESGAGYIFSLMFSLMGNGFRLIWLLIASLFTFLGIAISVSMARNAGIEKRIEGNATDVSIRCYKRGIIVVDRSFPRVQVTDIRTFQSGTSGSTVMKQVELIVGDKVEKVASWMDGEKADELARKVRDALGL